MKDFMIIPKGFTGFPMEEEFLSPVENKKNFLVAVENWYYGPEDPNNDPMANPEFYEALADAMQCDEKDARRKHCSNCGNYDNSLMTQVRIERIPMAAYDAGYGFRGHCDKLNFISNDMRVCQAWEEREDGMD
jgi:hypothetical protein